MIWLVRAFRRHCRALAGSHQPLSASRQRPRRFTCSNPLSKRVYGDSFASDPLRLAASLAGCGWSFALVRDYATGPIIVPSASARHESPRPATSSTPTPTAPRSAAGDRGLRAVRAGRRRPLRRLKQLRHDLADATQRCDRRRDPASRYARRRRNRRPRRKRELTAGRSAARRHRGGQAAGRGAADDRGIPQDRRPRTPPQSNRSATASTTWSAHRPDAPARRLRFASVRLYVLITESICKRPGSKPPQARSKAGPTACSFAKRTSNPASSSAAPSTRRSLPRAQRHLHHQRPPRHRPARDADGVHVGQTDLPATEARKLLGPRQDRRRQHPQPRAGQAGPSSTAQTTSASARSSAAPPRPRDFLPGLDYARQAAAQIPLPAVAIAGITDQNVDEVLATGVQRDRRHRRRRRLRRPAARRRD